MSGKCPVYSEWDHPDTGRGNYAQAPLRHNHQHLEQECPGPGRGTADQLRGSTPRKNPSSRAEQFITISAVFSVSSVQCGPILSLAQLPGMWWEVQINFLPLSHSLLSYPI